MAAAVRTLKTVWPHIPLIKFPIRGEVPGFNPAASAPTANSTHPTSSPPATVSTSKPIGATPRGSGIENLDLPKKYQRKLIDIDEMEFIERGGPA